MFRGMLFGRDSLEAALDIVDQEPELVEEIILTMAEFQGVTENPVSEEEPGKILHEWHPETPDTPIEEWTKKYWGADSEVRVYYTVDATPLFAMTVAAQVARRGPGILEREQRRYDGETVTVREAYVAALDWIMTKVENSSAGLLEYCHRNPGVLLNQNWKDSQTGMLHPDGSYNDFSQPIASLEVQGYAYDALAGASDVLEDSGRSAEYDAAAAKLRQRVVEQLWMPEALYFAQGIDRDADQRPQQVKTLASNAGVLLGSGLLDGLPEFARHEMVKGVVRKLFSEEFLTDVGIRCRSLAHENLTALLDYSDYHGTWAVWPKETFDIATGLRRQGLPNLAVELETRILNAFRITGGYPELYYVNPAGEVLYQPVESSGPDDPSAIAITNIPDWSQTWSITADLAIQYRWDHSSLPPPTDFEREILTEINPTLLLRSPQGILRRRHAAPPFTLDRTSGLARRASSGLNPSDTPLP